MKRKRNDMKICPQNIKNYILKDTLTDWLKMYEMKEKNQKEFLGYLFSKGNTFEKSILEYMEKIVGKENVKYINNRYSDEDVKTTIKYIEEKVPIIYSAPLSNEEYYGVADLIVRNDYLKHFIENPPKTSNKSHYVVIDIKFSSIPYASDRTHILNSNRYPYYKSQLYIYNTILGSIQGYTPKCAYILGKGRENISCFYKLGEVDFEGYDDHIPNLVEDAKKWYIELYEEGDDWKVDPPSRKELYPNMNVDSGDTFINSRKEELAKKNKEITLLYYCGVNNREKCLGKGIDRFDVATADKLGIKGNTGKIIDKIIWINNTKSQVVNPLRLTKNTNMWRECKNDAFEAFVDFEVFTNIFDDFSNIPYCTDTFFIFMIGLYYNGEYYSFVCENITKNSEYQMMKSFYDFVKYNKIEKLWYWYAENNFWRRSIQKHDKKDWELEMYDLSNVLKDNEFVIKDCYNYKLKSICNSLYEYGFIDTYLDKEIHQDGLSAMLGAWKYYQNVSDKKEIENISKYNMYDCKCLYEIIHFLREHM